VRAELGGGDTDDPGGADLFKARLIVLEMKLGAVERRADAGLFGDADHVVHRRARPGA
jgi:hypothetical protein